MKEYPFHNKTDHAVHIGGKTIYPGETRPVDASLLHSAHEGEGSKAKVTTQDTLLDILDGNVGQVAEALAGLSSEELDTLEAAEEAGNTRKGVMNAIAEARLALASDESTGDVVQESGES